MFFDSWDGVTRVLQIGAMAYVSLVVLLRVSGKRTLAKLNAFDLVVTVALGSTLATIALSSDVSALEGAAALLVLIAAQWLVATISVRWTPFRRAVRSRPVAVLDHGELRPAALRSARLTEQEVRQAVRASGIGDLGQVGAVVLETDGSLSVIPAESLGDRSALVELEVGDPARSS